MGTLFNQRPRQDTLESYISTVEYAVRTLGFKREKMTPADWHVVCDVARTALAIQNADAMDEQLAGFGEILQTIAENVRSDHPLMGETLDGIESAIMEIATSRAGK
jgi:hypothetical protein